MYMYYANSRILSAGPRHVAQRAISITIITIIITITKRAIIIIIIITIIVTVTQRAIIITKRCSAARGSLALAGKA